jgi:hypothetical protein
MLKIPCSVQTTSSFCKLGSCTPDFDPMIWTKSDVESNFKIKVKENYFFLDLVQQGLEGHVTIYDDGGFCPEFFFSLFFLLPYLLSPPHRHNCPSIYMICVLWAIVHDPALYL